MTFCVLLRGAGETGRQLGGSESLGLLGFSVQKRGALVGEVLRQEPPE